MLSLEENTRRLYPKIETGLNKFEIYNEKQNGISFYKFRYEYAKPEYEEIESWEVSEKIHGMHVRVALVNRNLYFLGKTETTKLPSHLLRKLHLTFVTNELIKIGGGGDVCLYGVVSDV